MTISTFSTTRNLRNLYLIRTVFQVLWAGAIMATAVAQPNLAAIRSYSTRSGMPPALYTT